MTIMKKCSPMPLAEKGLLIGAIIDKLNDRIREKNAELREQNLYSEQSPLHGGEMFLKLAFAHDDDILKIAAACGI